MTIKRAKPEENSIYSKVSITHGLMDVRSYTWGISFGSVTNICQQYGIKIELLPTCYKFTAPKTRLRYLIEKLHFSKVKYSNRPF